MHLIQRLLLVVVALLAVSCSTYKPDDSLVSKPPFGYSKSHYPKKTIELKDESDWPDGVGAVSRSGNTVVLDGQKKWRISGSRMPGECDQDEDNLPVIFFNSRGKIKWVFKNFTVHETRDGLSTNTDVIEFRDCVFLKICEDALNPTNAPSGLISGCWFDKAQDKTVQYNNGQNIQIIGNEFSGGICAVRGQGASFSRIAGNRFINQETAIQVTRKTGYAKVKDSENEFRNVKIRYKTTDGAKIDTDGSVTEG